MIQVLIKEIHFDLSVDNEEEWEEGEQEELQLTLQRFYEGKTIEVDVEEGTDDDLVYEKICNKISDETSWCIDSLMYKY